MKKQYILALLLIVSLSISVSASSFPDDYKGASVITGKVASSTDIVTGSRLATAVRGISNEFGNPSYINGNLTGYGTIFQIKNKGDTLEGAESVKDVIPSIDKRNIDLLKDEVFSTKQGDYAIEQTLKTPGDASSTYEYARGVPYDDTNTPASYMLFPKASPVYQYTASFVTDAVSKIDSSSNSYRLMDFEDGKMTLLGKQFTVLKAEHPAKDSVKLTLLSGQVKDTLKEGEKKDYVINGTIYTVEVLAISDVAPFKVKFKVNDQVMESIGVHGSDKVGNLYISVSEIIPNEAGDVSLDFVEFYLDSYQVELSDEDITSSSGGKEYKVNGKSVADTDVEIYGADGGLTEGKEFKISDIIISWTPSDKHYLGAEKYMSEIVEDKNVLFGDLDYYFYGSNPNNDAETIELVNNGDNRYTLSFENTQGEKLVVPLFILESGAFTRYGTETDDLIINETPIRKNDYFLVTTDGYEISTKAEGLTKLYRYKKQDVKDDLLTFFDVGANETIEVKYTNDTGYLHLGGKQIKINVTQDAVNDGDILVDLNGNGVISSLDVPVLVTKYKTKIWLDTATFDNFEIVSPKAEEGPALSTWAPYGVTEGHDYIRITVNDNNGNIDVSNSEVCLSYNYDEVAAAIDPGTSEAVLQACYDTFTVSPYTMMFQVGTTDVYEGSDSWGHFVEWHKNDNSPDEVYIAGTAHEDETMFFIIGKGASFYLKEDKKEEDVYSKDTILMGGPCVNEDTAKVMGLMFPSCGSEIIKKDSAFIKEYPYNGGKALVVFGYESADTINAVNKLLAGLNIPEKGLLIQGDKIEEAPDKIGEEENVVVATTTTTTTTTLPVVKSPSCSYGPSVSSSYVTETRKFGIGAKVTTYVKIDMNGLNGKLDVSDEKPFEAAFGVDWLDFTVHILKGSCDGTEVQKFTAHQANGDQTFVFDVKVAEPGCYCVKIVDSDLIIDSAKIKIIPDSKFEMMFGAE